MMRDFNESHCWKLRSFVRTLSIFWLARQEWKLVAAHPRLDAMMHFVIVKKREDVLVFQSFEFQKKVFKSNGERQGCNRKGLDGIVITLFTKLRYHSVSR